MPRKLLTSTVERKATTEGKRLVRSLQKHVAAYQNIPERLDEALENFVIDTAMLAYAAGYADTLRELNAQGVFETEDASFAFEKEIAKVVSPEQIEGTAAYLASGAADIVGPILSRAEHALGIAIDEQKSGRLSYSEGYSLVRKVLAQAGLSTTNFHTLETTIVTVTHEMYNAAKYFASHKPAIYEQIWGFRYVTREDDKVRPTHAAQEGVTLPKDDPWWEIWWPPNGYNCRCTVEILKDKAKIKRPDTDILNMDYPDPGFDGVSTLFNFLRYQGVNPNVRFSLSTSSDSIVV